MPWSSSHQRETAAAQEPVIVLSLIAHGTTSSCWRHNYLAARMAVLILTVGNISNYSLSVSTEPLEINGCYLRQSQHTTSGNVHSLSHNKHLLNMHSYLWVRVLPTLSLVSY